MNGFYVGSRGARMLLAVFILTLSAAGCSGEDGNPGPAGPAGQSAVASKSSATSLSINITGVTINSPPVVTFAVSNQDGIAVPGVTLSELRFTIAKLIPSTNGNPSHWQNYINTSATGAAGTFTQATRENNGTLVDHGNGTYTYTFNTDITTGTNCPATCVDANGNALDASYNPLLTHRVAIQTAGGLPAVNGVYTFRPNGQAVQTRRDIVMTASCNECHNELSAHDERIETQYCVMCHNPGSTDADTGNTVNFPVMIHKIHHGEELPSVVAGTDYQIIGYRGSVHNFSDVVFPQDIRNCTKCHDGSDTATPQGDYWKTQPNKAACQSCHDDVYFGATPDPAKAYETVSHATLSGVTDPGDDACYGCHSAGGLAGEVAVAHDFPQRLKAAAAKFQFNIIDATPTGPGDTPTITFSVTDPTNGDAPYDITTDPAFTSGGNSTLNVRLAWSTKEINNAGNGQDYGQPIGINALTAPTPAGGGTYTVTSPTAIDAGATGTLRVMMDGHPAGDVTTPLTFSDRLPAKSVFKDFPIDDATAVARRVIVDINKCDACHDILSLHGANRNDEPGVCVNCHNPNATDKSRRTGTGVDGKTEEAIDFKTMIHAIHAGAKTLLDGVTPAHGFREQGIVVYGYGGSTNDFSDVRFPGILNDCTTCHDGTSYELDSIWEYPQLNGPDLLGTTTSTAALTADPSDNLRKSPTSAVCSSCHDGLVAETHMLANGAQWNATQATIDTGLELCALCHGPGKVADVAVVHGLE